MKCLFMLRCKNVPSKNASYGSVHRAVVVLLMGFLLIALMIGYLIFGKEDPNGAKRVAGAGPFVHGNARSPLQSVASAQSPESEKPHSPTAVGFSFSKNADAPEWRPQTLTDGGQDHRNDRAYGEKGPGRVLTATRDGVPVVRASGVSIETLVPGQDESSSTANRGEEAGRADTTPLGDAPMEVAGGSGFAELMIPVPAGALVPAAFYDDQPRTEPQRRALERIYREFQKNLELSTPNNPGMKDSPGRAFSEEERRTMLQLWETARHQADQQYLILFGYQSYNQAHLEAAKDALRERRELERERVSSNAGFTE